MCAGKPSESKKKGQENKAEGFLQGGNYSPTII